MRSCGWLVYVIVSAGAAIVGGAFLAAFPSGGSGVGTPVAPTRSALSGFQNRTLLSTRGQLSPHDPLDRRRVDSHHRVHVVRFEGGQTYLIDLKSQDFDAYLRVEDSAGTPLAEADDNGVSLDARLTFQAPQDGMYRLVVTSFDAGEIGTYTLLVRE